MSAGNILLYCLRAGIFASVLCVLYALCSLLKKRKPQIRRMLCIAYLAALVQITVLRGGVDWQGVLSGGRQARLIPFETMRQLLSQGDLWDLCYNVIGNLIWFVPLGCILRKRRGYAALLCGALLSMGIELFQYLLMTGVTDVDDVILNAVGAYLGWALCRLGWRLKGARD